MPGQTEKEKVVGEIEGEVNTLSSNIEIISARFEGLMLKLSPVMSSGHVGPGNNTKESNPAKTRFVPIAQTLQDLNFKLDSLLNNIETVHRNLDF